MIARGLWLALVLAGCLATPAAAQDPTGVVSDLLGQGGGAPEGQSADAPADTDAEPTYDGVPTLSLLIGDYEGWQSAADRAETVLREEINSTFALNRLRDEIFRWREEFAALSDGNRGRLATVDAQIDALGPPPEGREESDEVAARRKALQDKRAALATPDRLAQEAFARADGLIAEIDTQIRAIQASRLRVRGLSPANPVHWPQAITDLQASVAEVISQTVSDLRHTFTNGIFWRNLPQILLFGLGGAGLLLWGRRWAARFETRALRVSTRWEAIVAFCLSLGQMVLPLIGLFAVVRALALLRLWDVRADHLHDAILSAGAVIIVARWLNYQLFPHNDPGPLKYDDESRRGIRRAGILLSWGLALIVVITAIMQITEVAAVSALVLILPLQIVIAVILFRLGRLLRSAPVDATGLPGSSGRLRSLIGLLAMGVAVITPILSALGYEAASVALFRPAVLTLAILGVVIVLQRLVYDIYAPKIDPDSDEAGPLMPVLIGFALFLLALPFLSLAWGARVVDLLEIWTRIGNGFALGETRISPTDFMTFVVVFVLGYILTRFIQSTLRSTVLPRTRIDLGGQNAIVAGFGYVGIAIAVVVAITAAGINLTSLAVVAGALSVGIGFGLQNIVQNFVSGIILLIERPISEGDMIEVGDQLGYVRDISVRSTRIETFDRRDVIIPNADLVSGLVTNWTRNNLAGRIIIKVGVAYGSDVAKVKEILIDVAESHPMVLADPPPQVFFMEFGDSSLNFEIRVILRDVSWMIVATSELNEAVDARFREAGIEIPFPQRDLWLRNPETLQGKGKSE